MKNSYSRRLCFILFCFVVAQAGEAHFVSPQFQVIHRGQFVQIAGLPFEVIKEKVIGSENADLIQTRLVAGHLKKSQYDRLRSLFSSVEVAAYDPRKKYEATDFLSPFVRALNGKQFTQSKTKSLEIELWLKQQGEEVDQTNKSIFTFTNCWTTALEFIRNESKVLNIYYPSQESAAKVFNNTHYFKKVIPSQLKYGDIVFISAENPRTGEAQAHHAAIYIHSNYFFEKTGSYSEHLYRLIHLNQLSQNYSKDNYNWSFLRNTGAKLPPPHFFSVASQESDLLKELGRDLSARTSVEITFSQGLLSYVFSSITQMAMPEPNY